MAKFFSTFLFLTPALLFGQSEAGLQHYFEGKYVTVKIEMPATKDGVDVYPLTARPLDLQDYSRRIKNSGAALRRGDSVMVTAVKVKEKNIEFQLGGGGFGTFGDDTGDSYSASSLSKTKRERDLEKEIKSVTDKEKKKGLQRELNDLRNARSHEDARLRAEQAQANEARKARLRDQALGAGSRFNLRYPGGVPFDVLTPEGIMQALADYVEFPNSDLGSKNTAADSSGFSSVAPASSPTVLRKGMTREQVTVAFGDPSSCAEKSEGVLTVTTCTYRIPEARAEGHFVDGVLVRYMIASE
jgi:hypothetical protein